MISKALHPKRTVEQLSGKVQPPQAHSKCLKDPLVHVEGLEPKLGLISFSPGPSISAPLRLLCSNSVWSPARHKAYRSGQDT